jgi:ABC-type transport system substrate-binding protein
VAAFAKAPSGTGPFKITEFKPRVSVTLSRNDDYWDKTKVPKLDKMVLSPMPRGDDTACRAAIGPNRLDRGVAAGCGAEPQERWVRDRYRQLSACFKALLKEAGFGPNQPVKAKVMISTSGSGQMLPLPMNEFLQQNLKERGFDISFEVAEWGTKLVALRNAPTAQQALGSDAVNVSVPPSTDISQIALYFLSTNAAPKGCNWANWKNEEFDKLIGRIENSSDKAKILKDTQRAHEIIVDEAPWAFIVHDRNPRAMTKKVKGFISTQSWFQDFTVVDME